MTEAKEFAVRLRDWRTATVLLATFLLTLVQDLTLGIIAGCALAVLLVLFERMRSRRTR